MDVCVHIIIIFTQHVCHAVDVLLHAKLVLLWHTFLLHDYLLLLNILREYVLDQLEAERKFLLFAHHQEMLDAVEDAVRAKVVLNPFGLLQC